MILYKTRVTSEELSEEREWVEATPSEGIMFGFGEAAVLGPAMRRHLQHWASLGSRRMAAHLLAMHQHTIPIDSVPHVRDRGLGVDVNPNTLAWLCHLHRVAHGAEE